MYVLLNGDPEWPLHGAPEFATHVPIVGRAPAAVAGLVAAHVPGPNGPANRENGF
jgi:hypothetical protein